MKIKTSIDYLNDLSELSKNSGGTGSDYAITKMLGVSSSRIANYRKDRSNFDTATCLKVAAILKINPLEIIAAMNAKREKDEVSKKFWKETFQRITGTAAAVILSLGIYGHSGGISDAYAGSQSANNIDYAQSMSNLNLI